MKRSTKFWIIFSIIIFTGLQFIEFFRTITLWTLLFTIVVYLTYCIVSICLDFERTLKSDELKYNVIYWIFYLPITKFNNWLNSL
jgi:hypothetical protein